MDIESEAEYQGYMEDPVEFDEDQKPVTLTLTSHLDRRYSLRDQVMKHVESARSQADAFEEMASKLDPDLTVARALELGLVIEPESREV
jgi:hypothetical protein